jgi:hypothetical protein
MLELECAVQVARRHGRINEALCLGGRPQYLGLSTTPCTAYVGGCSDDQLCRGPQTLRFSPLSSDYLQAFSRIH